MNNNLKKTIESYKTSDDKRPLFIDVSNINDLNDLFNQYIAIPKKSVFDLASKTNELVTDGEIFQYLDSCKLDLCFIQGLGTLLRLKGLNEFKSTIHSILSASYNTKFIFITYQCARYYEERVPKYKEKIVVLNSDNQSLASSLIFVDSKFNNFVKAENGISNGLRKIEKTEGQIIYVCSEYKASDFSESLLKVDDCSTPFDLICLKDQTAKVNLVSKYGLQEQWAKLLELMSKDSLEETLKQYVNVKNLIHEIAEWNNKSNLEKWCLFIYLKYKRIKTENWAIDYAINKTESFDKFIKTIYDSLLSLSYKEEGFWQKYKTRKEILNLIGEDDYVYKYCSLLEPVKKEDALYYLTDNTDLEKKTIIKIIDSYKEKITKTKLKQVLQYVYKDLYNYLCDFNLGDDFLNKYFEEYKYLKVINSLTPDFKTIVDNEAIERSFKRRLIYRREKLEELDYNSSMVAYFIDALGVEFMSFISRKCEEKGLTCRAYICKSNLPSITSKNTEFKTFFAKKGIEVKDVKELDELIHEGKEDFDFDKTKLPIHIINEFEIIERCITEISKKIKGEIYKKAIIVSDHGATRLAILNTEMVKQDVETTGEHGGRICKYVEDMQTIPNAIIEDDYCVLADYNAFKGGRVGKVEMHGGATLEEVTVPIIEIFAKTSTIEITVLTQIIKVSYKKNAILRFYSSTKLNKASVKVNGKSYTALTDDFKTFKVELADIKKSGQYKFEVWDNDEIVSDDNEFVIEKESGSDNDLWG